MPNHPTRDVFDVLTRDHRDLEAMIWDLEWLASRGDTTTAVSLQADLIGRLLEHAWIEEHVLLRRLDGGDELDEAIRLTRVGHAQIEHHLSELSTRTPGEPLWCTIVAALRDLVGEQVSCEEWRLFPAGARALAGGEALHLGLVAETIAEAEPDAIELDDGDLEEVAAAYAP
jgi:hypothetical protein